MTRGEDVIAISVSIMINNEALGIAIARPISQMESCFAEHVAALTRLRKQIGDAIECE